MNANRNNFLYLFFVVVSLFVSQCGLAQKSKVACVGNSITYGYGLVSPSTQSYPSQLQALLGTTSWAIANFGVSARTMLKTGDLPYWNEQSFTNAKAIEPNIVIIELGTNDAKTWNWNNKGNEFVVDYKEMIQIFRNLSSKPDVCIGLLPPGQNVSWGILYGVVNDSVNKRIKQIAYETGVGLIDIYDALGGNNKTWFNAQFFQNDSIHPSVAGAAIIAQKVKEMITMPKPQLEYTNGKIMVSVTASAYQWYFNGTPVTAIQGGILAQFSPSQSGIYKVSLKLNETNETRIVSNELYVSPVLALNATKQNKIKIYRCSDNTKSVKIETGDSMPFTVSFYDIAGKLCLTQTNLLSGQDIDVHELQSGNYILKIIDRNIETSLKWVLQL